MTTLTPNRDAVRDAAEKARQRWAEGIARDDAAGIGLRMAIEAAEAISGGAADILDREIPAEQVWPQVSFALTHALTGFLMTVMRGDADRVADFLPGALASMRELALRQLAEGPDAFVEGVANLQHPAGRA